MDKQKRVTMVDVAKAAGVSYQTVSRVINNDAKVAPETRARVLQLIQELNYHPNRAARNLAANQSHTLAVITYDMSFFGPTQMVISIERAARDAGYDLFFANINSMTADAVKSLTHRIMEWAVDGVLLIAPVENIDFSYMQERLAQNKVPLLQIDIQPGSKQPSVIIDQHHGSYLITKHLIELGHQRICEISGPLNWYSASARHAGFMQALTESGLNAIASTEGNWTAASGYEAAKTLLGKDFTAIVVANDQMAVGVMSLLAENGLRIPEDVSVVGFDDIPEARFFATPLTTIRQDFPTLGQRGLQYLIEMIEEPSTLQGQRIIKPQLICRASSAAPKP